MLVLRRKAGEAIVLNGVITIHVLAVEGERVKLGISAPPEVVIVRSELLEGHAHTGGTAEPGTPMLRREQPRPGRDAQPDSQGENADPSRSGDRPTPENLASQFGQRSSSVAERPSQVGSTSGTSRY